ncbi:MAG TPA: hypothetical protein VE820_12135 [Sphingomicrobium sp.]|nr:hypothetical protein [Sphingomicrobium sp.]
MRSVATLLTFVLAAFAAPQPTFAPRGARELAGRSPGPPQRCVLIQSGEALRVSETDPHMLLYGRGRTIAANRLAPVCGINFNDILVTDPIGPYYCRGDLVRSIDRVSRVPGAACKLGDFVPYKR